jgi:RimJ/RimL family protein N-acetyltransferase
MDILLKDGRRVVLRRQEVDDEDRVVTFFDALARDPDSTFYPMQRAPEELAKWLRRAGFFSLETNLLWVVETTSSQMVGHMFVKRQDLPTIGIEGIGQLYLALSDDYRRAGLGTQLLSLVKGGLREALKSAGLRRIVGHILQENRASLQAVLRAGFHREGLLKEHFRGVDGRYHDVVVVACLVTSEVDERAVAM